MDADIRPDQVSQDDASDAALLEAAHRIAARRTALWQRRALSPRLTLLLWALRIYVFLMLAVVAIQLARLV